MNGWRILDLVFPYIEKLTPAEQASEDQRLQRDITAIETADWTQSDERALDEAQKVATTEVERVRTAESKATTYLAVLAALVPVIITLQVANWEKKAGPAPDAARLFVLTVATIYVAAAGFHAFKTLQVQGFQRVGEAEIAAAWQTQKPLRKLTRGTLLATRRLRNAVNAKITRIRVTHEHLLRAFGTFVLLLLLDPLFYAMGFRNATQEPPSAKVVVVERPGLSPLMVPPACCHRAPAVRWPEIAPTVGQQPAVAPLGPVPKVGPATAPKPDRLGEAKESAPN
ncbi:hypothetical protein [Xanthobacter tagetidis]|uniref:Uncharacterized protein n=1 Tax=Xanthobacter tagetidis TaxID=60216 RepID=A0A3L7AGN0_9HYPH|nr:hypothetical protein [Xanthobacter tagetidis]MBB6306374.1 hypothetical protein [Xanthobacter tagetidis]RLP79633.1 hypothetical protein D9R14_08245 [Xanthobacter tagetidis]